MPMTFGELVAATIDPKWNQKFRGRISEIYPSDFRLPLTYRQDMLWLEQGVGAGAEAMIYAGGMLDLKRGITPKDLDTYIVSGQHPLQAMARLANVATLSGARIGFYDHRKKGVGKTVRVTLAWKRMKVFIEDRTYDIGFLQSPFNLLSLADDPDVNLCAIAATRERAVESARHQYGLKNKEIVFRSMKGDARDWRRHPERLNNYTGKFPGWPVRYADPEDEKYFTPLLRELGLR